MDIKNKKKPKKIDLLQLSDEEKHKLVKQLRENLQQKVIEAKLWQYFLETENITINGQQVWCKVTSLNGFFLEDIVRKI